MTEPQYSRPEEAAAGPPNADVWRKEIHSRVTRFRTRRGRRIEGAFSMRFPFPPAEPIVTAPEAEVQTQPAESDVPAVDVKGASEPVPIEVVATEPTESTTEPCAAADSPEFTPEPAAAEASLDMALPPQPQPQPEPQLVTQPRPRLKRKVIAFPRQAGAPETFQRLADPVLPEQPRILDVPEELEAFPTTPLLDGLHFDSGPQASSTSEHIELPFRAVGISQRIYAAAADCLLVAAAAAVFALVGHKMLPTFAFTKTARLTAAVVPLLFWAIYEYLLVVYAGRTVGMQVAAIRLTTFSASRPSLRHRRNRVLGLYLSTASLVMGLLWALVDIDALCWHDRISATYLTKRE